MKLAFMIRTYRPLGGLQGGAGVALATGDRQSDAGFVGFPIDVDTTQIGPHPGPRVPGDCLLVRTPHRSQADAATRKRRTVKGMGLFGGLAEAFIGSAGAFHSRFL